MQRWCVPPGWLPLAGIVPLLAFSAVGLAAAEEPKASEYEVKAAFIYNFAQFVEWPPEAPGGGRAFVVTVLGDDPFGTALDDALQAKTVRNRKVIVRRVSRVEDVGQSHVLFISDSETKRLPSILKHVGTAAVLTVGEMDDFAARGGVIGLRLVQARVRLDINVAAADRARLRISSQLLRLARIVDVGAGK